jgi:hypothetical protein
MTGEPDRAAVDRYVVARHDGRIACRPAVLD